MAGVVAFLAFQAAWWGTALLARDGHPGLASLPSLAFAVAAIAREKNRAAALVLAASAAVLGLVVDGALCALGAESFSPGPLALFGVPPFMPALWAAFACCFLSSLAFLAKPGPRPAVLAVVLGAVGGPLSYRGAAALGVLTVGAGLVDDGARGALGSGAALAGAAVVDGGALGGGGALGSRALEGGAALGTTAALAAIGVAWAVATPVLARIARALSVEAYARRARTVPRLFLVAAVLVALAPALFAAALVVDVVRAVTARRPFMSVRLVAFALVYFVGEIVGIFWLLLVGADVTKNYFIQEWWTSTLFRVVRALFRLRFVVDGDDCVSPGTVILVRHASIIDTLLPSVFITRAHGVKLRFVVKRELLEDPCLDIAGNRLPNHFVGRKSEDTHADLAAIRALAAGVDDDEALLVYPEGTRFTEGKRARAVASVTERDADLGARAAAMTHVLPPKPAGAGALFDGAPAADAVFVAHAGLEGFAHVADVWSGALVGRTVRVRMWRVLRADIPEGDDARARWLYGEWARVDAFIRESPP